MPDRDQLRRHKSQAAQNRAVRFCQEGFRVQADSLVAVRSVDLQTDEPEQLTMLVEIRESNLSDAGSTPAISTKNRSDISDERFCVNPEILKFLCSQVP